MLTKKDSTNTISSILKGEFIIEKSNVRLIPFLLLVVFLGLVNIRSSFNAEKLLKHSISLEKEVADLRLTYITNKSKGLYFGGMIGITTLSIKLITLKTK